MVSVEIFRARYPEFRDSTDGLIALLLNEAAGQISPRIWGRLYDSGVLALTAHLLSNRQAEAAGQSAGVQTVTSEKAGDVQLNYAVPAARENDTALMATSYGQRYAELRDLVKTGVRVIQP